MRKKHISVCVLRINSYLQPESEQAVYIALIEAAVRFNT